MSEIVLIAPTKQYAEQIMVYRDEMLQNRDSFDAVQVLKMCVHLRNGLILKPD